MSHPIGSEGIAYKGLSEGNHTLRVVATVNSSVISENQVSWLNEGSCKELGFIATVRLNGNTMRLRIYLATPGVTFRCRLDNGEHGKWQECKLKCPLCWHFRFFEWLKYYTRQ